MDGARLSQVGVGVYLAHGGVRRRGGPVRGSIGDMMDYENKCIMLESELAEARKELSSAYRMGYERGRGIYTALESDLAEAREELTIAYMFGYEDGKKAHELNSYIPYATVREILKVLRHGDSKHPGEEWKTILPHVHEACAAGHVNEFENGHEREEESGCHHLAHAIVRYMFALSLWLSAKSKEHRHIDTTIEDNLEDYDGLSSEIVREI
ncbi:MAG TPA: dATP/dGTP diphosphohydrolase domain-containing protein [Dissulfurispiraceae bacterium]|nr:dATP/dGTP diphosphohydrolase domain-containing protein [Dissulfurispiraceae bacterium]